MSIGHNKYTVNQGCCLCQPIVWSMAARLLDSVAVLRTRPRAIPLAMITMRKSTHGFPLVSYMGMGLRLAVLRAAGALLLLPDILILSYLATKTILVICWRNIELFGKWSNGPYSKMNTSIWTTDSRNLNSFVFSLFFPLICDFCFFYPWRHSLLINFVKMKHILLCPVSGKLVVAKIFYESFVEGT